MTKEFYTERDLDDLGLLKKNQRDRLIQAGRLPKPIRFSPHGKRLWTREMIDAIKALGKPVQA
jgi:hypothetical protein